MAELEGDIVVNATAPDEVCDGPTIVEMLNNELISREVLKYLELTDLKACTLVCQSISHTARCYIRDHFITDAQLPPKSSPCTGLAALESAMNQMDVIQFTGLHIYINECSAHPPDSPLIQMADDLHPNILSRLILKRLIIKFTASADSMCWMATKLIEKLLEKYFKTLREMRLDLSCDGIGHELLKLVHGGRIFAKLSKLTLNYCYLNEEKDAVLRKAFYSSFPSLQELSSGSISSIPSEQCCFVKHYLVSSNRWGDNLYHLKRKSGDNFKLDFLNVITTNSSSGPWKVLYGNEMEYLMQLSCGSLRTLIIQGQHFPKFSQLNIPPMMNLRYLQIVHSMNDACFLSELGKLCSMLPVLHSVHIHHSPCHAIHSNVEQLEDDSVIFPSLLTSTLKVQGLNVEMDILMPILAKYFPNLKELQVYDCHPSALEYIYLWSQLKCLALGGKTSYWNNNFDHVLIGLTEEQTRQWLDGAEAEVNPISLMTLKSLLRLYLIGGGERVQEDSNVLLSPLALSCLLKNLPNLAVRILPGYNGSVLNHLITFDNAHETLWCPPRGAASFDCDSSAFEHISLWLQLRCLGLGGKTSYWNDNFDQVLIGFTEEKMHQWIAGGNDEVNANSLMAVKSLMRLYLTGGGQKFQEESNVLLSPLVMSCLLTNLPNLALRVLPGYNGSVLSHLAPFENANETLWCPAYPRDVEALFCT